MTNLAASTAQLESLLVSRVTGVQENQVPYISLSDFIGMLEQGASGAVLKSIVQHIPRPVVIKAVGSDSTNFSKLFKRRLSKKQTDEINDLSLLWQDLQDFFDYNPDFIKQWISAPLPALEGQQPANLMDSFYGRSKVRECLEAMKYGDFA